MDNWNDNKSYLIWHMKRPNQPTHEANQHMKPTTSTNAFCKTHEANQPYLEPQGSITVCYLPSFAYMISQTHMIGWCYCDWQGSVCHLSHSESIANFACSYSFDFHSMRKYNFCPIFYMLHYILSGKKHFWLFLMHLQWWICFCIIQSSWRYTESYLVRI